MSAIPMPDLHRESYYSRALIHLTEDERRALWEAGSYLDARRTLSRQTVIPALSLLECVEALEAVGISLDQVDVVPLGIREAWQGEVLGQFPPPGADVEPTTRVRLFVSHPSLLDRLPEGFAAVSRREGEHELETVDEWSPEVHRERLEVARREEPSVGRLVRVLEAALWRPRNELRRIVGRYEGIGDDRPLAERVLHWVGVGALGLEPERIRWLGNSVWFLGLATGPERPAARLLECLLGTPVRVRMAESRPASMDGSQITHLGAPSCRLGAGAVLGTALDDRAATVELRVGPVDPQGQLRSRAFREAVEAWAAALLPVSRPWSIHYIVATPPSESILGGDEPSAVLGYTAGLGTARARSAAGWGGNAATRG